MSDAEETHDGEQTSGETRTWPELAISLYDRLTGRNAVIEYDFEDMSVWVPNRTGQDADHAHWRLDGTLTIATRDRDE